MTSSKKLKFYLQLLSCLWIGLIVSAMPAGCAVTPVSSSRLTGVPPLSDTHIEEQSNSAYKQNTLLTDAESRKPEDKVAKKSASEESEQMPEQPPVRRLTLVDAINRALVANRGLADATDRVEGARLSIVSAEAEFELKLLPGARFGVTDDEEDMGAGITLQKRFSAGTEVSIEPGIQRADDTYRIGMDSSLTQPLLQGLGREFNLSGVRSAEFAARSVRRSLYLSQVDTVLATVRAVYEVVRQRELVRLNEESAERLRGHAEAAKAKEKIGIASPIDTFRATIQLKQAEDTLATAREAYRDALDNLKVLLALPLEEEVDVDAPLTYDLVRIKEDTVIKVALENRVELDQAEDTIRETERQSRVARHNTLPELNVVLNYSRFGSSDSFGQSTSFDQDTWGISLETSTDIARTSERAAYDKSLLAVRAAYRSKSLQRDEVARQVKSGLRNLRKSEQRIIIQQEQIKQSEGKLELARVKFQHGLANNFDLIEAEMELRRAQTNLLSAVLNYIVGTYRLRGGMGSLLEGPERF